jgi:serine phosphatase RsbU (regulator of sigma subunit)
MAISLHLSAQQKQIILDENSEELKIQNVLYVCDTADNIGLEQIQNLPSDHYLIQTPEQSGFKETCFTYWIKFDLVNSSERNLEWLIDFDKWLYVNLYVSDSNSTLYKSTGHLISFKERDYRVANRNLVSVSLNAKQSFTCYAKLKTNSNYIYQPVNLDFSIYSKDHFARVEQIKKSLLSFFIGIYLVMFLYNLFVFISTRDKNYLYYLGLMLILFIAVPHNFGYAIEIFQDTDYYLYYTRIDLILSTIFGFLILLFTRSFLSVKENFPLLNKMFNIVMLLLVIVIIPSFIGEGFLAYNLSSLIGLITLGLVLTAAIKSYRRKNPSAGYFLLAYSSFIIGVAILLLKEMGVLPVNVYTEFSMQFGSSIEAVLFSFALANRINILKKENIQNQTEIIRHLKENELLQTKVTRELENKVEERTTEINFQKKIIEQRNRDIVESIRYAKRIQEAILPEKQELLTFFPESFILYEPKDIVSGDFYWTLNRNDHVFYAIADCTGHGVPGGFMSMLAISLMNEIVIEKGMDEPADILNMLRVKIILALKQTGASGENKDGMDMIFCRFNKKDNTLTYAAANNPLWIVRNGEMLVFPADKQPVGVNMVDAVESFNQHTIQLQKNDCIYAITDGYADQFGGPKGKKFSHKRLKDLLVNISGKDMNAQHETLGSTLKEWKGNLEQVDDISLAGIRI